MSAAGRTLALMAGWTPEREEILRKFWDESDLSASRIAKAMGGLSRVAVIGKARRLGLSARARGNRPEQPVVQKPTPRKLARRIQKKPRIKPLNNGTYTSYFAPTQPKLRAEPMEAQPRLITIGELREADCRWPIGDPSDLETFRYCGAERSGPVSYCPAHCRMAYQPRGGA